MGNVIGVDCDPVMIAAAQRRTVEYSVVDVRLGDVHALPVAASSVDRARADRVLQHVDDPAAVIAELRRVTRPGAVVTLAEPDWATLAIDADDLRTSADFTRYICAEAVKNSSIGRQLARLAGAVGFTVRSIQPVSPLFSDYADADRILGLTRSGRRAVAAGLHRRTTSRTLACVAPATAFPGYLHLLHCGGRGPSLTQLPPVADSRFWPKCSRIRLSRSAGMSLSTAKPV